MLIYVYVDNTIPDEGQTYLKNYIYFLIFGQILNGFAGACIFSIGLTFLDHNSSAKNSALYIGKIDYLHKNSILLALYILVT